MSQDDKRENRGLPQHDGSFYLAHDRELASLTHAEQQLSLARSPVFIHSNNPHERLYIACLDGTGNDEAQRRFGPETNVAKIHDQTNAGDNKHIYAGYTSGPGTQNGWLSRTADNISGRTYNERVEEAYKQLIDQVAKWRDEDPLAQVRVIEIGFSRGAEEAAGLARLIHERGIQNPDGAVYTLASDGLIAHAEYTKPPLVPPGQVAQAELLFDPVGTGHAVKHQDRRPPPSVLSGFQISAADEHRSAFKSDHIIDPGVSSDGRFLGVTVAGAHSDIGGSYKLNGLGVRTENMGINYVNSFSDVPFLATQVVPEDPRMSVVHRSERALPFALMGTVDRAVPEGYNEWLVPRRDAAQVHDPFNAEPRDDALNRQFERQSVQTGPQEANRSSEPENHETAHATTTPSSTHGLFEALCSAAADNNPEAMRVIERNYLQSDGGQAWLQQGRELNQQIQLQAQQAAFDAQQHSQMERVTQQSQGCAR